MGVVVCGRVWGGVTGRAGIWMGVAGRQRVGTCVKGVGGRLAAGRGFACVAPGRRARALIGRDVGEAQPLARIHIPEPTRLGMTATARLAW